MEPSFQIRPPVPDDVDRLAELHVATWREAYAQLLPASFFTAEFLEGRRRMWRRITEEPRPERAAAVAEIDRTVVGFALAGPALPYGGEPAPRSRQLFMLYVLRAHYGTGMGQTLLETVLHGDPAVLWVAQENPRAIAFYERNGFAFDGVTQTDPGAPLITDARMVR